MRIEAGLVEKSLESTKEKSRSNKKNRRGKKKSMPSGVQKLFDTCKEVFSAGGAGIVPSPGDVERLRLVLDNMKPADVGLNREMTYFQRMQSKGAPPITYLHLYECDKFSIGIFCLPPSGVIPLHNHPGMTVFSKLLFGSMHIKSYDWADIPCSSDKTLNPSYFQPSGVQLATVKTDDVFTAPCKPLILYPAAGGNMHCFTAKTSCAVLDVLGPPYNDSEGRHCTYYRDHPYASFSEMGVRPLPVEHAFLQKRDVGFLFRGYTQTCPERYEQSAVGGYCVDSNLMSLSRDKWRHCLADLNVHAFTHPEGHHSPRAARPNFDILHHFDRKYLPWVLYASISTCSDDPAFPELGTQRRASTGPGNPKIVLLSKVDTELGSEREGYAWLEEREKPDDFIVVGAKYKGPKIVEN